MGVLQQLVSYLLYGATYWSNQQISSLFDKNVPWWIWSFWVGLFVVCLLFSWNQNDKQNLQALKWASLSLIAFMLLNIFVFHFDILAALPWAMAVLAWLAPFPQKLTWIFCFFVSFFLACFFVSKVFFLLLGVIVLPRIFVWIVHISAFFFGKQN